MIQYNVQIFLPLAVTYPLSLHFLFVVPLPLCNILHLSLLNYTMINSGPLERSLENVRQSGTVKLNCLITKKGRGTADAVGWVWLHFPCHCHCPWHTHAALKHAISVAKEPLMNKRITHSFLKAMYDYRIQKEWSDFVHPINIYWKKIRLDFHCLKDACLAQISSWPSLVNSLGIFSSCLFFS